MHPTRKQRRSTRRNVVLHVLSALLLVLGGLIVAPAAQAAEGVPAQVKMADLSQFQPGNIISDAVFYNSSTMSEEDIQAFLNSKVSNCRSGYTCLKDKTDATRSIAGDAMCSAYSGGGVESAARIIYKVAHACGINPQVLIVMLQKEQGLVTDTWPTNGQYRASMGQGCPDTAPCDAEYYGFFNQLHGAAWQLKRYGNPPGTRNSFTWYAPGSTANVQYSPNAACGSSPVYIANKATAALYYYTPYQPNRSALAAGYGLGDSCGAYGNRNFFQYFTDWFGSTQGGGGTIATATAAIEWEYQAQGGVPGLGDPVSEVLGLTEKGGGYARAFAAGSIYWSAGSGAKTVRVGPLRDYYFAREGANGDMGWPLLNQQALSSGSAQVFSGGSLYAGARGTFIVRDPLRLPYFAYNGADGTLGWPTGDQTCAAGVCAQAFERGSVISSSGGAFAVTEPVSSAFVAAGGIDGPWGVPLSAAGYLSFSGGGYGQAFAGGSAYYQSGGSPVYVTGEIRDRYFALGGASGELGFPVGAQTCADSANCQQQFQFGWILWNAASGARVTSLEIEAAYASQGGSSGQLGASAGPVMSYPYAGGGQAQAFAGGAIFFAPGLGAFAVTGEIRDVYFAAGGAAGAYGWPSADQSCAQGICTQQFQGGIIASSTSGTFGVQEPVTAAYDAAGGVGGSWGIPLSPLLSLADNGGGYGQVFTGGSVYYRASGDPFLVSGAVRDAYFASGGAYGGYGWPVGAQACAAGTCTQKFEGGSIQVAG